MRKMLAIAMAAIMAFSCVTIGMGDSGYSDAATDEGAVGDAWGFDYELTVDDLMDMINSQSGEDMDKAEFIDTVKALLGMFGVEFEKLDFDLNGEMAGISELVKKDANGSVYRIDTGIDICLTLDIKLTAGGVIISMSEIEGELDETDDEETVVIENDRITVTAVSTAYLYLTPEDEIAGYSMDADISVGITGKTNSPDYAENAGPDGLSDVEGKAAVTLSASGSYDNPVKFIPEGVGDWKCEGNLQVSEESVISATGYLAESIGTEPGETQYSKYNDNDAFQYLFSATESEDGYMVTVDMGPYATMGDAATYYWPVENNLPEAALIDGSLALDDSGRERVNGILNGWRDSMDMDTGATEAVLEFHDLSWETIPELTATAELGSTFVLPDYTGDVPEGTEFIGWTDEDGNFFGAGYETLWVVKGNFSFYAEFGTFVDDVPTVPDNETTYVWNTDIAGVKDVYIDAAVLAESRTVVNVTEDGVLKYSCKFFDSFGIDDGSLYSPEINELSIPNSGYVADTANGHSSLYLGFESAGNMGNSYVTYNVGDTFEDGDVLCVYRDTGEGLEFVETVEVYGNVINIHPGHCSNFLIVSGMPGETGDSDEDTTLLLLGIGALIIIVVIASAVYLRDKI